MRDKKVTIILPAYNAEKTLKKTVDDLPEGWFDEVILVDDKSQDRTVEIAKGLGLIVIEHEKNLGYGGNQKTCYNEALKRGADIVVMVHPDHQYDPGFIPKLIEPLLNNESEAVFGSRMLVKGKAREGGMPIWKYIPNIFLTKVENLFLSLKLTEYHSGFRAYSAKALNTIDYQKNSDDFVFDTEIIVQLVANNLKIKEIPITTRYFPEASSVNFRRSVKYGLDILKTMLKYLLHRSGIKRFSQFQNK